MVDKTSIPKPRMGVMLRQKSGIKKSGNLSSELVELQTSYKDMQANFKKMDKALKQRHAAMIKMEQARGAVAEVLTSMSKATPLEGATGETYTNAMEKWSTASQGHAEKFKTFALDYVAQWESTVSKRIGADTKETDSLRREADHYQAKVEALETSIKKLEDKSKPVPDATTEKLERNKEKLEVSNTAYNTAAESLKTLMEEVVNRSWRDLHPLLIKCLKFDLDVHEDEQVVLEPLKECVDYLMNLSTIEDIKERIEDIANGSPEDLSTQPGGGVEGKEKAEEAEDASPEQPLSSSSSTASGENPFDD